MICESCGCSESRPCFDEDLEQPCQWVRPGLCSNCAFDQVGAGEPLEIPAPLPEFPTSQMERFPTFRPRQVA
jgi:hypothetical protein